MNCPRCTGNMVLEVFEDLRETGQFRFEGSRCLVCGEILDPVIMKNRESLSKRKRRGSQAKQKQSHPTRIPNGKKIVFVMSDILR